ncbi:hypothetical protein HYY75_01545 [bacterium]|nr:hypothetical protein [bacterium]
MSLKPISRFRNFILTFFFVSSLFFTEIFFARKIFGDYFSPSESDPVVRAILWGPNGGRAWIDYKARRYHVCSMMRLDNEWFVSDIRRESILFERKSSQSFIEMPLVTIQKPTGHTGWSFWGDPLSTWETLEILAKEFDSGIVMHRSAGGGIVPQCHGHNIESFLKKLLPPHHRYKILGSDLLVLPVHPQGEHWTAVLSRIEGGNAKRFSVRFPGLSRKGTLLSRGDDIQAVLRQIALGAQVPIQFPRNLHFRVYAMQRNVPFYDILVKIVYLNQCSVFDREEGLEVQPWPKPVKTPLCLLDASGTSVAGFEEPQDGWGPAPPPQIPGERLIKKSDILPTYRPWTKKSYSGQDSDE